MNNELPVSFDKKHTKRDIISIYYMALFIVMVVKILNICLSGYFNQDCYFLINTGEYIINNKSIPTMNVWTIHQDFKIVVQQWLCCISNYIAYDLGNNLGLAVLTIIYTVILNILLMKFISLYTNNKRVAVLALCLANYLIYPYMNTRPSLVTMSVLTYELIQLELWNKSSKGKKNNIKLLISLGFISLLHINYHSALWLMDILFIFPYMVPAVWKLQPHNLKKEFIDPENKRNLLLLFISIAVIIVTALINPNGINAIKYLGNSKEILANTKIIELLPWYINDTNSIIIISIIVALTVYIVKGGRDKALIYLTLGTVLLSIEHARNFWTIMFIAIRLFIIYLDKREPKKHPVSKDKYIALAILYTIIISAWAIALTHQSWTLMKKTYDDTCTVVDAVDYLNSLSEDERENLIIYNDFNSGAYLELNGYKTYIDARPELYMESINGKADIYQEWVALKNGYLDIPKFIEKYQFNTFVVDSRGILNCYLHYSDDYKQVVSGNGYKVYRLNCQN